MLKNYATINATINLTYPAIKKNVDFILSPGLKK